MNANKLEAKVKAINKAHAIAKEWFDKVAPIFVPFLNQKIIKADGYLLAKVEKLLPEQPNTFNLNIHKYITDYSVGFTIKTSEQVSDYGCLYYETTVYIGNLKNGVLTTLSTYEALRTNYTAAEILEKRQLYETALKISNDAKSNLHPFGDYDQ